MKLEIHLHCHNLPGNEYEGRKQIRLGIQKGTEAVDDVSADADSATFIATFRVEFDSSNNRPNFLGPFAHGTRDQRFIYLCWTEETESRHEMFRRAKIHLNHLSWADVEYSLASNQPIEATLNMTDARGGPLCASVRGDAIEWGTRVAISQGQ